MSTETETETPRATPDPQGTFEPSGVKPMGRKVVSPEVTVLMCVYNEKELIREAVESLFDFQTLEEEWELVVIDDGSTDKTLSILKALQIKYNPNRLRVFSKPHAGLTKGLNFGLNRAKGTYIARSDADDISFPTRLSKQLKFLKKNPEITAVGTAIQIQKLPPTPNPIEKKKNEEKKKEKIKKMSADEIQISDLENSSRILSYPERPLEVHWTSFFYCPLAHPSVMFNRNNLPKGPLYSENNPSGDKGNCDFKYSEDYALWHRLTATGHRLGNLALPPLVSIRKRSNGISSKHKEKQQLASLKIIQHFTSLRIKRRISLKCAMGLFLPIAQFTGQKDQKDTGDKEVTQVFDIIISLEKSLLESSSIKSTVEGEKDSREWVKTDCTKRLGELATMAMKLGLPEARSLWSRWISRDSGKLLSSLLGLKSQS
ncbi:hypothetical protein AAMO2058_000405000 [Amorphochlora amoebiformis]